LDKLKELYSIQKNFGIKPESAAELKKVVRLINANQETLVSLKKGKPLAFGEFKKSMAQYKDILTKSFNVQLGDHLKSIESDTKELAAQVSESLSKA
jgi:hypothetical protein